MNLKIDLQSDEPIYIQIRNEIIRGIATGMLKPEEPLPSVRKMADDIDVNMHTVNKAYAMLKKDGFIIGHRQRGVVVNKERPSFEGKEYEARLKKELDTIVVEALCRRMSLDYFVGICQTVFDDVGEKNND